MDLPHRSSTLAGNRPSGRRTERGTDHAQAVDQPIRRPVSVDSGLQDSKFLESVIVDEWNP